MIAPVVEQCTGSSNKFFSVYSSSIIKLDIDQDSCTFYIRDLLNKYSELNYNQLLCSSPQFSWQLKIPPIP